MGFEEQFDADQDKRECEAMRKMFVGGLNRDTTKETFEAHFSQYGNILDCVIITDPNTKMSRGFGFVTYQQSESVENCFQNRPHNVDGKTLDTKRAMPREFNTVGAHQRTKKLFIGGFKGANIEPQQIQDYIESRHPPKAGKVELVDLLKDKNTGELKGFGFITTDSEDFADRLAISESSFQLNGRQMSIKKAEPKEGEAGAGRGGGRGGRGGGRGRGGNTRGGYNSGGYNQGSGGYNQGYNQGSSYNQGYNQGQWGQDGYGNQGYGNQGYSGNTGYSNQQYSTAYPSQQSYSDYSGGNNYNQGGNYNSSRGASRGGGNRYAPY